MNRKLLAWLVVGTMLLSSACSSNEMLDGSSDPYVSGEEVTVSFTIAPEGEVSAATRAVHYPDADKKEWAQISDGSKAKQLIYAVYDKDYKLLEQYGTNYTNQTGSHYGQVVENITEFPHTISLRLMRKQTYHIVFWAQNEGCTAYDTNDLTMVEVKYDEAKNNDELRDAFCKTETFTVSENDEREVILTRPLAQINVGTAGYDYEAAAQIVKNATATDDDADEASVPTAYLYSKIEIPNVAKYFDVLRNQVLTGTNDDKEKYPALANKTFTTTVIYDWARIPAYVNYQENELPEAYPSIDLPTNGKPTTTGTVSEWYDYYRRFQEQFLRVKLYDTAEGTNEPYLPYISKNETPSTLNPSVGENNFSPDTETFKYLSMCYVLVPDQVDSEGNRCRTTLGKVTVSLKHTVASKDEDVFSFEVLNVPAQRNWRTNIFGKNLLTLDYTPNIYLDPIFKGEYNKDGEKPWEKDRNSSADPDADTQTDGEKE